MLITTILDSVLVSKIDDSACFQYCSALPVVIIVAARAWGCHSIRYVEDTFGLVTTMTA
jgi:hypothetical protein